MSILIYLYFQDLEGAPLLVAVNKQDKIEEIVETKSTNDKLDAESKFISAEEKESSETHNPDGGREGHTAGTINESNSPASSSEQQRSNGDSYLNANGNGNGDKVGHQRETVASTADILLSFGLDEMAAEKGLCSLRVQPTSARTG